jgi:hypothetical protein
VLVNKELFQHFADGFLALTVSVVAGRINEVDALLKSQSKSLFVFRIMEDPIAAKSNASTRKADVGRVGDRAKERRRDSRTAQLRKC